MKVQIDRENCIGCGACASVCPEVFKVAGEGEKAEVIAQPETETDALMKAIDNCPMAVIYFE